MATAEVVRTVLKEEVVIIEDVESEEEAIERARSTSEDDNVPFSRDLEVYEVKEATLG